MACPQASFPTKQDGNTARRTVRRAYKANTSIFLCGVCDKFHLRMEIGCYPVSETWQLILDCLAQGMTNAEMSARTGLKPTSVIWAIEEMKKRFYALNRPHLIAISISLGIVNPNSFVPSITESTHADSA